MQLPCGCAFAVLRHLDLLRDATKFAPITLVQHLIGARWHRDPGQARLYEARSQAIVATFEKAATSRRRAAAMGTDSGGAAGGGGGGGGGGDVSGAAGDGSGAAGGGDAGGGDADEQRAAERQLFNERLCSLQQMFAAIAPLFATSDEDTLTLLNMHAQLSTAQREKIEQAAKRAADEARHQLPPSAHDSLTMLRPPPQRQHNANSHPAAAPPGRPAQSAAGRAAVAAAVAALPSVPVAAAAAPAAAPALVAAAARPGAPVRSAAPKTTRKRALSSNGPQPRQ